MPLGDYVREIIVDPGVVSGQVPTSPRNWWPWIVAGVVVAGLLWMSQDDTAEEDDDDRPFAEAG